MRKKATIRKDTIESEFVTRIISLFPSQIVRIIFFGSRAKGIPRPGSDYDFLVVLKERDQMIIEKMYDVVTDFLIKYGADLSLKIYKEKRFKEMAAIPTPFMASILKTGREVWSQISES